MKIFGLYKSFIYKLKNINKMYYLIYQTTNDT